MRRLCFLGDSHAALHLAAAARKRGFQTVDLAGDPELVFVSQDTPTNKAGERDVTPIRTIYDNARAWWHGAIVVTSQVEPGFCRTLDGEVYHQAETLRLRDAAERALNPEMIIVGRRAVSLFGFPQAYADYLSAFKCPVLDLSLEEAEFAKIAINTFLAAQVETTNRLAAAAAKVGANWGAVVEALRHDSRIGPHAYLEPGRWQASPHLLRDAVTLERILR